MTLYHYYTYFKSLRDISPLELSVACIYLAKKIQFEHISLDEILIIYNKKKKKLKEGFKNETPDFIKYEIDFYYYLGYDLDIETPYHWFGRLINSKEGKIFAHEDIRNFLYNLINDTYRKPLCLYFHPKIIMLSSLIFTIKFLDKNITCEDKLTQEEIPLVAECMEKIYEIFSSEIKE